MERKPIRPLTGLRFFAAPHVVWFHYAPGLPHWPGNIVRNGYMAVALFFVLSGFVLAYTYEGRTVEPRRFWLARFARIYPGYLTAFCLIAPAVALRLSRAGPLPSRPRGWPRDRCSRAGILRWRWSGTDRGGRSRTRRSVYGSAGDGRAGLLPVGGDTGTALDPGTLAGEPDRGKDVRLSSRVLEGAGFSCPS
jgi:hypothetical protein